MSPLLAVLESLRRRPGMYIGEPSLTRLAAFLRGYDYARHELLGEPADPFFISFQEWSEHRFRQKNKGWAEAILLQSNSESQAFDRFWELLDEYLVAQGGNGAVGSKHSAVGSNTIIRPVQKEHGP